MRRLTIEEKETLTELWNAGYKYIARDSNDFLNAFTIKPWAKETLWAVTSSTPCHKYVNENPEFLKFIKWTDKDPCETEKLLLLKIKKK